MKGEERLFDDLGPRAKKPPRIRARRAKDGVVELREFGGWTLEKLRVLELYLKQYRQVAGNGTYIDGFAGQGGVVVAGSDVEHKGSVRIAFDAGAFSELWVFEVDQRIMQDLNKELSYWCPPSKLHRRVRPVLGDFNKELPRLITQGKIRRDRPCFAFLDPNSTELSWDTVELLAKFKEPVSPPKTCKTELWILFNSYHALARLIDRRGAPGYAESGRAAVLDRVMGGGKPGGRSSRAEPESTSTPSTMPSGSGWSSATAMRMPSSSGTLITASPSTTWSTPRITQQRSTSCAGRRSSRCTSTTRRPCLASAADRSGGPRTSRPEGDPRDGRRRGGRALPTSGPGPTGRSWAPASGLGRGSGALRDLPGDRVVNHSRVDNTGNGVRPPPGVCRSSASAIYRTGSGSGGELR